jgi:hypothetical protein
MNTLIENICEHGTISFDYSEKGYTIIFEPNARNSLSPNTQSTVLIVRNSPSEAAAALNLYIASSKHWTEYPEDFWDKDFRHQE